MALHFILDGYNVIKQVSQFADLAFDAGRERLIRVIEREHPQGSVRNQVTVFFDGKPGKVSAPLSQTVKVVFTYEQSADEQIIHFVQEAKQPRQIVVVTNDREIQRHVKASGAVVWTIADFMNKLRRRERQDAPSSSLGNPNASKTISKVLEHTITTEMEKVWLTKRKTR